MTNIFTSSPLRLRMTYGKRLQKALEYAEKERKELAAAIGCTPQIIGMVITSTVEKDRKLSVENHVKAARYLRIDSYWLATGEGEMVGATTAVTTAMTGLSHDALELARMLDEIEDKKERKTLYIHCGMILTGTYRITNPIYTPQADAAPTPAHGRGTEKQLETPHKKKP